MVDLKDSQVHTFVHGRKVIPTGPKKKKGPSKKSVLDIFTEGKEVLENGLFDDWKDRTGKVGADVFGCDAEYQRQQEGVLGDCGIGGGERAPEDEEIAEEHARKDGGIAGEHAREDEEVVSIEFDAEADLEIQNEI